MAGEVLNMNILDINKHWCKLKRFVFQKTATNHILTVGRQFEKNANTEEK